MRKPTNAATASSECWNRTGIKAGRLARARSGFALAHTCGGGSRPGWSFPRFAGLSSRGRRTRRHHEAGLQRLLQSLGARPDQGERLLGYAWSGAPWRRRLAVSVTGATEPESSPAAGLTTGRPSRCSRHAPRPPDDEPPRRIRAAFVISPESPKRRLSTAIGRNWRQSEVFSTNVRAGRLSSPGESPCQKPSWPPPAPPTGGHRPARSHGTRQKNIRASARRLVCGEGVGGVSQSRLVRLSEARERSPGRWRDGAQESRRTRPPVSRSIPSESCNALCMCAVQRGVGRTEDRRGRGSACGAGAFHSATVGSLRGWIASARGCELWAGVRLDGGSSCAELP